MIVRFRRARRADVQRILELLTNDRLGQTRELAELAPYLSAFDSMQAEGHNNRLIVGEDDKDRLVATYQLTFIYGLSLGAARRAQVESVRVVDDLRGKGIGKLMLNDAETRARAAGCKLIQLTMDSSRTDSHKFYESLGFTASHIGFKRYLEDH